MYLGAYNLEWTPKSMTMNCPLEHYFLYSIFQYIIQLLHQVNKVICEIYSTLGWDGWKYAKKDSVELSEVCLS